MKLDRKKIIIGIIILAILIILGLLYFFLMRQEGDTFGEKARNLFPFDGTSVTTPGDQGTVVDSDGDGIQDTFDPDVTETVSAPRLRRISDFPTGGFIPLIRTEKKDVAETETDEDGSSFEVFRTIEASNHYVRYSAIDDATIFETLVTPNTLTQEVLVDNYIPNAEHAFFSSDGSRAIFQYWNKDARLTETYLSKIEKIPFKIEPCPYDFSPIKLGDDDPRILGLHEFLNRNPQTRVARTGINSPGNESSLVVEATLTAIKNFQSLYQITIDGNIGAATREQMLEVCNDYQEQAARAKYEALKRKYTISGFFLPQNIISVNFNPLGDKLFYLQKDTKGSIGTLRNLLDESKSLIFESTFSEWTSLWETPAKIEIMTKPSYAAEGFSYNLDPETKRYFKSFPESKGQYSLPSPDGEKYLVYDVFQEKPRLSVRFKLDQRSRPLRIQSFPEKCTWSVDALMLYCAVPDALAKGGEYPDTWYQGLESYRDSLWKINMETFEETLISDLPVEYNEMIDVSSIMLDPQSSYLYFLDKKTEFLWSYRLDDN